MRNEVVVVTGEKPDEQVDWAAVTRVCDVEDCGRVAVVLYHQNDDVVFPLCVPCMLNISAFAVLAGLGLSEDAPNEFIRLVVALADATAERMVVLSDV